jgi:hypothetical protein
VRTFIRVVPIQEVLIMSSMWTKRVSLSLVMLVAGLLSCSGDSSTRLEGRGKDQPAANGAADTLAKPDAGFRAGVKGAATAPDLMDEEDAWDIVSFTDPRDSEVYDIVDGRVIIALKDPPVLETMDADYFDEELSEEDDYLVAFAEAVPETLTENVDVADFLAAEELTVYAEWPEVGGLAVQLPESTSVEDAISDWPTEYSDIIAVVDADEICVGDAWPADGQPNDLQYDNQWAINDDTYYPDPSAYQINIQAAWHNSSSSFGSSSQHIAILDTGVDYNSTSLPDLGTGTSAKGCNVGDKRASTTFALRSSGGGRPWQFLLDESAYNAHALGHGTCIAGITSAGLNNDPPPRAPNNGKAIAGIAKYTKYFPIAAKARSADGVDPMFTTSALLNGFTAIGCVARIYSPSVLYGANFECPYYNIKVANLSWTASKPGAGTTVGLRHMAALSPYIVFVCSSGNNNSASYNYFPANYSSAISVCNYTLNGDRYYGNYDGTVDIAAPGLAINTLDMVGNNGSGQYLGYNTGIYYQFAGTSAAAPHVAAVAAILAAIDMNSGAPVTLPTPSQMRTAILSTKIDDLPDSDLDGIGRMDAAAAIDYLEP